MFFFENHGYESMGRCKMRLRKWFLIFWIIFLGFPDILGGVRNKIPEFGSHLTQLGRACVDQTQNLRKNMKSTWVMNKSLCGCFLMKWCHNIPILDIYNLLLKFGSKQSTLKIWVSRALGWGFHLSPLELEMFLEKNSHRFWKFGKFI